MKEQVSVDDALISVRKIYADEMPEKIAAWQAFLKTMGNLMLTVDIAKDGTRVYQGIYAVALHAGIEAYIAESQNHITKLDYIEKPELDRLKRLDDNVKNQIARLKSWRDSFIKHGANKDVYPVEGVIWNLKLLESLDK